MSRQLTIPIFDINVDEDGMGLFGLSFVDNPATQVELHAFKKEEAKVFFSNHEKREVVAPVLIPNQLIYRETEGIPYYMRASAETIQKIADKYMLSGNWNNFTYMHERIDDAIESRLQEGVYLQKLWIIKDENDDANTKYGFDLPVGTLMMKCKVANRQIWSEIKEGKLRGISLEAFFGKINSNKALQITYSKMKSSLELFQKFIAFLNEVSQEADGIADEVKKDETNFGEVSLKYYLDDEHYFEVDAEGFVRDENGEPISEGEYKLADGNVFVVSSEGKFAETKAVDENTGEEHVEAPIADGFKEEEEKKDEEEDDSNDGEPEPKDDETPGEDSNEDSEQPAKDSDEEDDKKDELEEEEPKEEPKEEEKDEEEKPEVNAVPYSIGNTEYLLPVEVVNYIESLLTSKIEVEERVTELEEQTPSAMPIGAVVKNGNVDGNSINDRIQSLNAFKNWRENRNF